MKDFWEDLVNLSPERCHYTGVLTLKQIKSQEIRESEKEYWLVEDHAYKLYHIVDGQQRLTTFIIFLQSLVEVIKALPGNQDKVDAAIFVSESLSIDNIQTRYLFKTKPTGDNFRTYNRGKKLSDLELLKNRLIYLTTLYNDEELDDASRKNLRDEVNDAWKEVYYQLGRNRSSPLNDDDFLRAHWTMFFKYSRKTGQDYIRFLLDQYFTPQRVHKKIERLVSLETATELSTNSDFEGLEGEAEDPPEEVPAVSLAQLQPTDIRDFVFSLKESAVHWFNSFNPYLADNLGNSEQQWIDRLNRTGMVYFRPLVMAILKNKRSESERIQLFQNIERFIFIAFRMMSARANYRSSEFYNLARELDRLNVNFGEVSKRLSDNLLFVFDENGKLGSSDFHNFLLKKFTSGSKSGYYRWSGLRYFLYEYELSLLNESRHKKVDWNDLLRPGKDVISIEHILPQTETNEWERTFAGISSERRAYYVGSLGNLLLLSSSINSALQNDTFEKKKLTKYDSAGRKIRNGYSDGSHSEIEVSQSVSWGPEQIRERGLQLLRFMETRWNFSFADDQERKKLLFLGLGAPPSSG